MTTSTQVARACSSSSFFSEPSGGFGASTPLIALVGATRSDRSDTESHPSETASSASFGTRELFPTNVLPATLFGSTKNARAIHTSRKSSTRSRRSGTLRACAERIGYGLVVAGDFLVAFEMRRMKLRA
jgi:hypothetical protein